MWLLIFSGAFLLFLMSAGYLIWKICYLEGMERLGKGRKWMRPVISTLFVVLGYAISVVLTDATNAIIIYLHLCMFCLLTDLCGYLYNKLSRKRIKRWTSVLLAVVLTGVYLMLGAYQAVHVVKTTYEVQSEKNIAPLKLALIADSHISTLFDGDGFAEHLRAIEGEEPDALIIAGDFVDDDSRWADVVICCKALGEFTSKYGVYYAPGNHDRGYHGIRDFSYEDMKVELERNGVGVLEDRVELLGDEVYLLGRRDKSEGVSRKPIEELVSGLDHSKYMVVIDHQPNDYKAEAASRVDLVLSGHTHGGQMLPVTYAGEWLHLNDFTYGMTRIEKTNFIVTSGIADWKIRFKTGCKAEYVMIEIRE